jgi:Amt family ammonium transporter
VHGIGGIVGMIGIGLIATKSVNLLGGSGLFIHGSPSLLWKQLIAILAVGGYSFIGTFFIAKILDKTIGFRVSRNIELEGLDTNIHAESAYDITAFTNR